MIHKEKEVVIRKKKHTLTYIDYENLEELMLNEPAGRVVELFNYRSAQLQLQNQKELLRPTRITLKEKRMRAFNKFSKADLKKFTGQPEKFEAMLQENMRLVEKEIAEGIDNEN